MYVGSSLGRIRFCIANCQISCADVINVNKQDIWQQCGKAIAATRNCCRNNKYAKDFTVALHHILMYICIYSGTGAGMKTKSRLQY